MSYSSEIKNELYRIPVKAKHCALAEFCGILFSSGTVLMSRGGFSIEITSENKNTVIKSMNLLGSLTDIPASFSEILRQPRNKTAYLLSTEKISGEQLSQFGLEFGYGITLDKETFSSIVQRKCCRISFLRGAFLGGGSMIDPRKAYHLEIVLHNSGLASAVKEILAEEGIPSGISEKKNSYVVYLKELDRIRSFLGTIGAMKAVLDLDNIKIYKDIRNSINRVTNFDNANMDKTIDASQESIRYIHIVNELMGIDRLSPRLREVADLRLTYPEASLSELSEYSGKLSKSCINHRLRKIKEIALSETLNKGENQT